MNVRMYDMNLNQMKGLIKLKKEKPEEYKELIKDVVDVNTDLLIAAKAAFEKVELE